MYFSVRIIPNQDNQEVEKKHAICARRERHTGYL